MVPKTDAAEGGAALVAPDAGAVCLLVPQRRGGLSQVTAAVVADAVGGTHLRGIGIPREHLPRKVRESGALQQPHLVEGFPQREPLIGKAYLTDEARGEHVSQSQEVDRPSIVEPPEDMVDRLLPYTVVRVGDAQETVDIMLSLTDAAELFSLLGAKVVQQNLHSVYSIQDIIEGSHSVKIKVKVKSVPPANGVALEALPLSEAVGADRP